MEGTFPASWNFVITHRTPGTEADALELERFVLGSEFSCSAVVLFIERREGLCRGPTKSLVMRAFSFWLVQLLGALAISAAFTRGSQCRTSRLVLLSPIRSLRGMSKISASSDDNGQSDGGGAVTVPAIAKVAAVFLLTMLAPIYGVGIPLLGQMTDFSTVENRPSPNECFVAPAGFLRARAQIEAPTYAVTPDELLIKLDYAVRGLDRVDFIAEDKDTRRREYVVRSKIFQWPDVVTVTTMPAEEVSSGTLSGSKYRSTLALHSYSIYGEGDLGVNRARAEDILQRLQFSLCGTDPSKSLYCR